MNRGDLHQFERPARRACLDNAVRDPGGVKLAAGLPDDFAPMRQHQYRAHGAGGVANDLSADDGFARTSRCNQ